MAAQPVAFMGHSLSRARAGEREMVWDPSKEINAAGEVDLARLARSLVLNGERVDYGRYRVTGGREPHWVDLYTARTPRCDCADHLWRDEICKHILAALLREGNERVVRALGDLFTRVRQSAKVARARRVTARRASGTDCAREQRRWMTSTGAPA